MDYFFKIPCISHGGNPAPDIFRAAAKCPDICYNPTVSYSKNATARRSNSFMFSFFMFLSISFREYVFKGQLKVCCVQMRGCLSRSACRPYNIFGLEVTSNIPVCVCLIAFRLVCALVVVTLHALIFCRSRVTIMSLRRDVIAMRHEHLRASVTVRFGIQDSFEAVTAHSGLIQRDVHIVCFMLTIFIC